MLHSLDDIKHYLAIDHEEIAGRRKFFGIDDSIADRLKGLHEALGIDPSVVSGHFYDQLFDEPHLRGLLADAATLARLKTSISRYFHSLTAGSYGDAYIDERLRVGLVHRRVGLEPKWYIGAYRIYLEELLPLLWQDQGNGPPPARLLSALNSLLRLIFFDMSLALDTYHGAHLHELAISRQEVEAGHRQTQDQAATYAAILDALPANIALLDEHGVIVSVNAGWRNFAEENRYRSASHGVGSNYLEACAATTATDPTDGEGAEDARRIADGIRAILRRDMLSFDHEYPCHSPLEQRWFRAVITPIDLQGRPGAVVLHVNITDRKERELSLWHSANYDALTELPNRVLSYDRLATAINLARRTDTQVAVLFIDFDRFKTVNDLLGHAAGDQLLQIISWRLRSSLRDQDTLGRISGDEFLVILPNLKSAREAQAVAEKLMLAVSQPIDYNGQETFVTCSIGIAVSPEFGHDADHLIRCADAAMYQAKQSGRNRAHFYTGDIQIGSSARLQLESDLRRALERQEYQLHYQPKADMAGGRMAGAEALLRWQHPSLGLIAPADFIPLLEETGLIFDVGAWVIRQACQHLVAWQNAGLAAGRIAVNISPLQLQQADFVELVREILRDTGCSGSDLEFEITESYLLHNPDSAAHRLRELHQLGIEFAIDDFGTGYSNLGYLRRLPIHALKIDRSFVRDIAEDPDDAILASTIILLAKRLRLRTVAEGVETELQLKFLAGEGCDYLQGYLYSRPIPEPAFRLFLAARPSLPSP